MQASRQLLRVRKVVFSLTRACCRPFRPMGYWVAECHSSGQIRQRGGDGLRPTDRLRRRPQRLIDDGGVAPHHALGLPPAQRQDYRHGEALVVPEVVEVEVLQPGSPRVATCLPHPLAVVPDPQTWMMAAGYHEPVLVRIALDLNAETPASLAHDLVELERFEVSFEYVVDENPSRGRIVVPYDLLKQGPVGYGAGTEIYRPTAEVLSRSPSRTQ